MTEQPPTAKRERSYRVRLSVDRQLYLCLGKENKVELGVIPRDVCYDEQLHAAILDMVANNPAPHFCNEAPTTILRPMSALGG